MPPDVSLTRVDILGVGIHATNMAQALSTMADAIATGRKGYVCVTGVHGVMEAQHDPKFAHILNTSLLTVPDGMPTVWLGWLRGFKEMDRVYGPEFMLNVCRWSAQLGHRHFLYGGQNGVAEQLKHRLVRLVPELQIVGCYTPPFRPLHPDEIADLRAKVEATKPHFFWVGLSTPKQEHFMAEFLPKLNASIMVGVGAAFDIHTGRIHDAPHWIKRAGLQWAHRLVQDPGRLWKRYLVNNPKFVAKICNQLLLSNKGGLLRRPPKTGTPT